MDHLAQLLDTPSILAVLSLKLTFLSLQLTFLSLKLTFLSLLPAPCKPHRTADSHAFWKHFGNILERETIVVARAASGDAPFNTVCLPLIYRGNPGVNGVSYRGDPPGLHRRAAAVERATFHSICSACGGGVCGGARRTCFRMSPITCGYTHADHALSRRSTVGSHTLCMGSHSG